MIGLLVGLLLVLVGFMWLFGGWLNVVLLLVLCVSFIMFAGITCFTCLLFVV